VDPGSRYLPWTWVPGRGDERRIRSWGNAHGCRGGRRGRGSWCDGIVSLRAADRSPLAVARATDYRRCGRQASNRAGRSPGWADRQPGATAGRLDPASSASLANQPNSSVNLPRARRVPYYAATGIAKRLALYQLTTKERM
jgi:hypothetical protein